MIEKAIGAVVGTRSKPSTVALFSLDAMLDWFDDYGRSKASQRHQRELPKLLPERPQGPVGTAPVLLGQESNYSRKSDVVDSVQDDH